MSIENDVSKINRDLGELSGLFKAHIKETERDRTARNLQRVEDRADRKVMQEHIAKLAKAVDEIPSIKDRVEKVEKSSAKFEQIYLKITIAIGVAAGIISGALWLAYEALTSWWPALRSKL